MMSSTVKTIALATAMLLGALLSGPVAAQSPLFAPIYEVLTHPRCLNCHTESGFPRQGDERRRHDQLIVRGDDNHGAPTLQCNACHQDQNSPDGEVPGAQNWALAPLSMAWENKSALEVCTVLKDKSLNGGKDLQALHKHMENDSLVLWGFAPGGDRSLPPLDHAQFVDVVKAWVNAGGPC